MELKEFAKLGIRKRWIVQESYYGIVTTIFFAVRIFLIDNLFINAFLVFKNFLTAKLLDKTFCKWLSKLETHCEFNEISEDQRMKLICKLDDDVIEWLDHIQSCSVWQGNFVLPQNVDACTGECEYKEANSRFQQ